MRRKDRQLSAEAAAELLEKGDVCHLAMVAQGEPYLVTMNYGFSGGALYLHSAHGGRKMELLHHGARVCFTVVPRHQLVVAESACSYSVRYESVTGYGRIRVLETREEKVRGLQAIMAQYAPGGFAFPDDAVDRTAVLAVDIEELSGKSSY